MIADAALEAWVCGLIEAAKVKYALRGGRQWRPGERFKLLFAGYNGVRNTGADVRVHEMLRQIKHILGPENVQFSLLTQNFQLTKGYFHGVDQVKLHDIFPLMLVREVRKYDGVVACEGSMFKSGFANALTTMMIGFLGMASAQNKMSVGYGAEAGAMDALLRGMCRRYCKDSLILTRNEQSKEVLKKLGIWAEEGTDTAWTFESHPRAYGESVLKKSGWDGTTPVLGICPVNPFWWPVKPALSKLLAKTITGAYADHQYRSLYFHKSGSAVTQAYDRYLTAIARAVDAFRKERRHFVILIGMERLDIDSCRKLSARLGGVPIFSSAQYDMYELVSVLRCCHFIVSSRYHGLVSSMSAGVPSAGVSMDERIRNLMQERRQEQLLVGVEDADLEERLFSVLRNLQKEREGIQRCIYQSVARNLKRMAHMGIRFEQYFQNRYPEFPKQNPRRSWEEYLPPMSMELHRLLEIGGIAN